MPDMDTPALVQALNEAAARPASMSHSEKQQLIEGCTALLSSMESDQQKLVGLLFAPLPMLAAALAVDMRLFDVASEALERGETVTLQQLSEGTKCDALLIKRVIRVLVTVSLFSETDDDVFQPQPLVRMYTFESPASQTITHMAWQYKRMFQLPDYFEEKGYQSPADSTDGPFQYAMGTKKNMYEWIETDPKQQHAFNVGMAVRSRELGAASWFDIVPMDQWLEQPCPSGVFMVELGGGMGQNMISLQERYKDKIPGKLVAQDRASVTSSIKDLPPGVVVTQHDFFEPQPLRHANAYFIGAILHNWDDKHVKMILRNICDAMGPDSVLLMNETVMPERGASLTLAGSDFLMMNTFASLERTEKQFRDILNDVGLQIVRVWSSDLEVGKKSSLFDQFVVEARLRA